MRPASPAEVAALRRRLGWPAERRYLLHVGTLQPRKNLGRLVAAFAAIASEEPDVELVLAGKRGWGREDPAALAGHLGVGTRVHLLGYVPRTELPALYGSATAVVVPSLYEGFGLPVLEALACGVPVAASWGSSLPEVAGSAALYFDPLDVDELAGVLRRLLAEAPLRRRLSEAGPARAREFTWERCAAATQAVLERAARAGRGGGRGRIP
jgi:glycosyltransferase involved in cell wall biosynthesis